jgi:SPFH domain / Band 7 family
MNGLLIALVVVAVLVLLGLALSVRIVQQYEKGVLGRLGRVVGVREPGLRLIVPVIEVLRRVSLRIVTMPIQSQGIITRDEAQHEPAGPPGRHGRPRRPDRPGRSIVPRTNRGRRGRVGPGNYGAS